MPAQIANHMRLDGKVAVVTGGAQGVGLGIAQEFVDYGATVVIADINEATLKEAGAVLGPNVTTAVVDVTNLDQVRAMYADTIATHGRLDAVVANVGAGDSNGVQSITEKQFDFVFGVNVKGVLFTVQPAIDLMKDGGTIVIIGSTASIQPPTGMSLYGGAKAALRNMVRAWIQEVRGTGIRINVLSPGAVDTPSLRSALADASGADQVDALVTKMGEGNPLGRLARPRELGTAAVFLASEASSFITGVELFADGGMAQTG
ncbi:SDR family NAD(P)-dependent oxidoreductase [Streptacidiphilus sp. N1-3]|uniref:SDR family NAD(P)-dependent oxidoreductase n=1 Tax=Streptacidiphilus alkalitolerans TaxID=3342712 RepID=A0ABV6X6W1_9ACTN